MKVCQLLCEECHKKKTVKEFKEDGINQGSKSPHAKLTEEQVREILDTYRRGEIGYGYQSFANRYGVSRGVIQRIIKGRGWLHVDR